MSTSISRDAAPSEHPETSGRPREPLVFAEQIALLHERSLVALTTVVVNAAIVTAVFWRRSPRLASLAWLAAIGAISIGRALAVRAYRDRERAPVEAPAWARIFV